tara:strand:+ start:905 stop:1903 length:999 start_codon:yes stop_codon:yes gene_type:complete
LIEWHKLKHLIEDANNIILSTHRDPDGDGLGSEMGMYYYLKSIGKKVEVVNISSTPARYRFLDTENVIKAYSSEVDKIVDSADLLIAFDLGDFNRLGEIGDIVSKNNTNSVNLDHHVAKDSYNYTLSIINDQAPSTTFMVWEYFGYLGINNKPLPDNIALPLYAGLVNDTGSFRYDSVTSKAHDMASHMLKSNINPNEIFSNIYENRRISKIHLLSSMINKIELIENSKIGYVIIDEQDFENTKASNEDAEGFSEFIRGIDSVEISFSIIQRDECYKVSFRSDGKYTVNDIAGLLGGGGHRFAAGCSIPLDTLNDSLSIILEECKRKIKNGN